MNKGRIIIIAGPSGVGTVIGRLLGLGGSYALSVSATTRAPRPGERDGVNYYFMTRDEFTRKISAGEMLEYAEYVGNLYGTPRDMVREKDGAGVRRDSGNRGGRRAPGAEEDAGRHRHLPASAQRGRAGAAAVRARHRGGACAPRGWTRRWRSSATRAEFPLPRRQRRRAAGRGGNTQHRDKRKISAAMRGERIGDSRL